MHRIYLDHSATTPVDPQVAEVVKKYMVEWFGNPSSLHSFGREAKEAVENARDQVSNLINCSPDEVYFTSGGTESDNLALIGYALRNREHGNHVIISNVEHPAIWLAAEELERLGFEVSRVEADRFGTVHPEDVISHIRNNTILASVMHVNNEVGTINNIGAIGRALRERDVIFHTDAVQSFGKVAIDVREMCVDLLSLSSHKIYGPKGVGALFIRKGLELHPQLFGGHQQDGIRPGTENIPGIVGIGKAAEVCADKMEDEAKKLSALRDNMRELIFAEIDDVILNGHPENRLPGNLNLSFHGVEGEALLLALDLAGIAASTGSACSSGSTQPSRILMNIGLRPEDAQSSLRLTFGRSNTTDDIRYAAGVIIDAVKRLRSMSGVDTAGFKATI